MHKKIIFCLIAAVILTACSPKADIFIQDSGDAVITVDVKASSLLESLVENAAGFSEGEKKENKSVFNIEEIKAELESKHIRVLSMETQGAAGIKTKLKILTGDEAAPPFLKTEPKEGKLSLNIGNADIREFVNLLSEDDREYVELLMAPALTGEELTSKEYEELIKSAYGEKTADELKRAKLRISVTCPKKVQSITVTPLGTGRKEGNKAYIEIPLSKLLSLKNNIFVEVRYVP